MSTTAPLTPTSPRAGLSAVGIAAGGLVLLGTAAALGTGQLDLALRTAPSAAFMTLGAVVLTSPALLVAHQLLTMSAPPDALVDAITRSVGRMGALCAGLSPFVLFWSVTSGLAPWMYGLSLLCAAGLTGATALSALVQAERSHTETTVASVPMGFVATAWLGLTALIALRLGVSVFGGSL